MKVISTNTSREYFTSLLMALPALFFLLMFFAYPLILTIIDSFFSFSILTINTKKFIGFEHYINLFQDPVFYTSIKNNFIVMILSILFQIGFGIILAALLTRCITWGNSVFRVIYFAPMVFSTVAAGLIWKLIYDPNIGILETIFTKFGWVSPELGWLGNPDLAIFAIMGAATWQYTGFMTIILLAGMQGIPEEIYEAARLDGANEVKSFFYITLPSISNVILVCFLITIIGSFKIFDLVYVLTLGGPGDASQVLGTYIYKNALSLQQMGYASTLSVFLLLISLVLGICQLQISGRNSKAEM